MNLSLCIIGFTCFATLASAQPIEGTVGLGQTAYADGPRVRPDRVVEDSRCPVDVQCVRAGRMIVRVTVIGGGWEKVLDLTLGTPVPVADGQITLTKASPERSAGEDTTMALPYRFSFLFQGGR